MYCNRCASHNDEDAVYCIECGTALITRKNGSEPISPARRSPAPLPHPRIQPSAPRRTWYFNTKDWLGHLSQLTGLDYYEQHRIFGHKSGALIGSLDGYLAGIGLGRSDNGRSTSVHLILRYGKSEDTARTEECIKLAKGHFKTIKVSAASVVATRIYIFRKPTPESVAEDLAHLTKALKSIVHPLNGRCEECHCSEPAITLVNRVPRHLCESCKNQLRQRIGVAAAEYAGIKSNLPRGIFYGSGAAIVGAVGWCVLASTLNRIFVYIAVAIGLLVGKAVIMGIGKVNLSARVLTGVLTLASVFLGDVFFYTFDLMRITSGTSGAGLSFGQAFQLILGNLGTVMADNGGVASIIFALVGAGFIVFRMRTPKFEPIFETVSHTEKEFESVSPATLRTPARERGVSPEGDGRLASWILRTKVPEWPVREYKDQDLRFSLQVHEGWASERRQRKLEIQDIFFGDSSAEYLTVSFMPEADPGSDIDNWIEFPLSVDGRQLKLPVNDKQNSRSNDNRPSGFRCFRAEADWSQTSRFGGCLR